MDKCPIYEIANRLRDPYRAGRECMKAVIDGRIGRHRYFNPYEPDTKDGEDFSQGAGSVIDETRSATSK